MEFCVILQTSINPLVLFYATQIINSFRNLIISVNHEKVEEFQPIVKSIYPLLFFYCRITFTHTCYNQFSNWSFKISIYTFFSFDDTISKQGQSWILDRNQHKCIEGIIYMDNWVKWKRNTRAFSNFIYKNM